MTEGSRAREGEEALADDGSYLGRWYYNPNVGSYYWEAADAANGKASTRDEAKQKLIMYLVNRRLEKQWKQLT